VLGWIACVVRPGLRPSARSGARAAALAAAAVVARWWRTADPDPGMNVVPRIFSDHRTSIRKKAGIERDLSESSLCDAHVARQENQMSHEQKDGMHDLDRDRCALVAGVPRSSLPSP
jgi:hypothetical protein